jgi:hypothetical protein
MVEFNRAAFIPFMGRSDTLLPIVVCFWHACSWIYNPLLMGRCVFIRSVALVEYCDWTADEH